MDEMDLWENFARGGKVEDYLAYRKRLEMIGKMEVELCDEDERSWPRDSGTEHR